MKKPKCIATFDCHNRNNQTWECNKLTNCISQHLEKDSKVIDVKNLAKKNLPSSIVEDAIEKLQQLL